LFKLTPEKEGIAGAAVTLRGWLTIGGVTLFIFPGTTFLTTVTSAVKSCNCSFNPSTLPTLIVTGSTCGAGIGAIAVLVIAGGVTRFNCGGTGVVSPGKLALPGAVAAAVIVRLFMPLFKGGITRAVVLTVCVSVSGTGLVILPGTTF
jgi:hypothetical protein